MSGFAFFYLIALIPCIIGTILWIFDKRINWMEWLGGTAMAFLVSAILHGMAIYGMTADIETWSGKITHVIYRPAWTERWTGHHSETTTDSKGHSHTRTWTTTEYDHHPEHWTAYLNFGTINDDHDISESLYKEIVKNFGGKIAKGETQSNNHFGGTCVNGDDNTYVTTDETKYIYPVTTTRHFENKIKAAPTVFSFAKVPTNMPIYLWPENPNWMQSDRVLGIAKINPREWDVMNTLGAAKKVNVIIIGFNGSDSMLGKWQEAAYFGGKKTTLFFVTALLEPI